MLAIRKRIDSSELQFPNNEYHNSPMSLYWYARSASEMPLLQFLAFYQTIAFFFPLYSQAEASRKIQHILKDPSFRSDRGVDIARILAVIGPGSSYGFGDERSQLKATLQECLDPVALRDFLTANEEVKEIFSSRTEGITDHKLATIQL